MFYKAHESEISQVYQFIELFGKLAGAQICFEGLADHCEKLRKYSEKLKSIKNFDVLINSALIHYFRILEMEEQKISQKQIDEGFLTFFTMKHKNCVLLDSTDIDCEIAGGFSFGSDGFLVGAS